VRKVSGKLTLSDKIVDSVIIWIHNLELYDKCKSPNLIQYMIFPNYNQVSMYKNQ